MQPDIPQSAIKALAALAFATDFVLLADGGCAATQPNGMLARVADTDLAALTDRALIAFGDDDESGTPRRLTVTAWGKTFLRRYLIANNLNVVRKAVPQ